jgi:hypothetical protein
MKIIETSVFTRQIQALMVDDDYRLLQEALVIRPELGNIIPGSGGVRKMRWSAQGRGKRGGARVVYYWAVNDETLFMLLAYGKSSQENMTQAQVKILRKIVEEEFNHG